MESGLYAFLMAPGRLSSLSYASSSSEGLQAYLGDVGDRPPIAL
jgi:hypothetical protein